MKAEDLTGLIAQGEGISLEFKLCGNQPQQVPSVIACEMSMTIHLSSHENATRW
ncbi:MAG: hypothetical protein Q4A01_12125 [Coriobacteriales bacterium]|nr:hypothetical protein [Coriobacteriales bacterium]